MIESKERRFSNITGGWKRDMELRIRGPKSWDPVLFGVGGGVMSLVGFLRYPSSTSILRINKSRRSLALWTDG
ncbi:MAG: hypothetical protein Q8P92_05645 [Candidatus Daviesbacteria bacterium]|nr:hypothetical protein [Candidatus Daviesbacteria bacterium]